MKEAKRAMSKSISIGLGAILFCLSLFASDGAAEKKEPGCISDAPDWIYVAENENNIYYSNVKKITSPSKGVTKVWIKIVAKGERLAWDELLAKWMISGPGIAMETLKYFEAGEMLAVFEIRHRDRMLRLGSTVYYNKKGVSLRSLEFPEKKWHKIPFDPSFEALCKNLSP